jgi:hypothetical protein
MSATIRSWSLVILLGLGGPLLGDPGSLVDAVSVKPVASREIAIPEWEPVSTPPKGRGRVSSSLIYPEYNAWTAYVSQPANGRNRYGVYDTRPFAFSPDGKSLLTLNGGSWRFETWDVATGKKLQTFDNLGRTEDDLSVAFFPDGKTFAVASHDEASASVTVWDVEKGRRVRDLDEGVNAIPFRSVSVSSDGRLLALAGVRQVRGKPSIPVTHFWDVASGKELRVGEAAPLALDVRYINGLDKRFESVCFAPDGKSLAAVLDHRIVLLDAATGKERRVLARHYRTFALNSDFYSEYFARFTSPLAFAPDGQTLAAGCDDGAVRLWDVRSGREYPPLVGHVGLVRCLMFSLDGKTLRSFGIDNKVLTWSLDKLKLDWFPRRAKLEKAELEVHWEALAGDDILARHIATQILAAAPESTVSFLREHIKRPDPTEMEIVKRLLADLKKEDLNTRKRTADELGKHLDLAVPAIYDVGVDLRDQFPIWVWYRLRVKYPTREHARALNALDVLVAIDTGESRLLLKELSEGVAESLLTRQALVLSRVK